MSNIIEMPSPACDAFAHEWKEVYYGYLCSKCKMFVADGTEPWAPVEDDREPADDDDYDPDPYGENDYGYVFDEPNELEEALMNCSMGPDGLCGKAGSEECDFECPFSD